MVQWNCHCDERELLMYSPEDLEKFRQEMMKRQEREEGDEKLLISEITSEQDPKKLPEIIETNKLSVNGDSKSVESAAAGTVGSS